MASTFTPLHDRVLIKRTDDSGEQRTPGGIIIPDSAREKPQQGEVIALGKGKLNEKGERLPMDVKVGDIVAFGQYSGSKVPAMGEEYITMREDEIIGTVSK